MGDIKFVTSLVLISLFSIAILYYVIGFANDNNASISLAEDAEFSNLKTNLTGGVDEFRISTNTSSKSFFESEVSEGDQTTRTGGQFKVGIVGLISSFGTTISVIKSKIFGNDPAFGILLTAFVALLSYMGVRYIWQTWRGGSVE